MIYYNGYVGCQLKQKKRKNRNIASKIERGTSVNSDTTDSKKKWTAICMESCISVWTKHFCTYAVTYLVIPSICAFLLLFYSVVCTKLMSKN